MIEDNLTVEDILFYITPAAIDWNDYRDGLRIGLSVSKLTIPRGTSTSFTNEKTDFEILENIGKKVYVSKHKGLTDKQYDLVCKLLRKYPKNFLKVEKTSDGLDKKKELDLEKILSKTKYPVVTPDRSNWIDVARRDYEDGTSRKVIKVRFMYNKKFDKFASLLKQNHPNKELLERDQTDHNLNYYQFNEDFFCKVYKEAKKCDFSIGENAQEAYDYLNNLRKEEHVPGVYRLEIKNVPEEVKNYLNKEVGELNEENLLLYKDRSLKYGLSHFNAPHLTLSSKYYNHPKISFNIATREGPETGLDPSIYPPREVFESLVSLRRTPILVALPNSRFRSYALEYIEELNRSLGEENFALLSKPSNSTNAEKEFNRKTSKSIKTQVKDLSALVVSAREIKSKQKLFKKEGITPQSLVVVSKTCKGFHNFNLYMKDFDCIVSFI